MQNLKTSDEGLYCCVRNFLYLEAEVLDDWNLKEWLARFVDEKIHYVVALRLTRLAEDGDGFETTSSLQDDDFPALRMRINRLDSKASWAENPPTRVRHFITNIRIGKKTMINSEADDFDLEVKSNVLIYRSRGESPDFDLLSAERRDVLRQVSGNLKLLSRDVMHEHTTIGTHNLSFIF
jgi:3-phenylpropionate/cinnamic acid dioxygenase small subunit